MSEWRPRRFWKATSVLPESEGYGVGLDDRPLRTPARHPLRVRSRALAEALAAEVREKDEQLLDTSGERDMYRDDISDWRSRCSALEQTIQSQQLRLKRLYSGANYRATTSTVQVPIPRAGSGVGAPRIRDLELIEFVSGLITVLHD